MLNQEEPRVINLGSLLLTHSKDIKSEILVLVLLKIANDCLIEANEFKAGLFLMQIRHFLHPMQSGYILL